MSEHKRVYFIGGSYMGCNYVRCHLPALANGWLTNYMGLAPVLKPQHIQLKEMQAADIVVFHRADTVEHHKMAIALKKIGKKIVFDNDDTFHLDKSHAFYNLDARGFKENVRLKNNVINNFIRNCDMVTASTEFLAEEYREHSDKVVVLPNLVNPDDWDKPLKNKSDVVRIGIVGSTAYYHDFDTIKDTIKKLHGDKRVKLVLFGLHNPKQRANNPLVNKVHLVEYDFWDKLTNIEHVGWVEMVDYFDKLNELRLDMMIVPRRESYFNKAKSNVKFLEASMLEIPFVTNYFPGCPYEFDIKDNENGRMITDNDWDSAIEDLIVNKDKRIKMGKAARKYVLANYNINKKGHLWNDAYNKYL